MQPVRTNPFANAPPPSQGMHGAPPPTGPSQGAPPPTGFGAPPPSGYGAPAPTGYGAPAPGGFGAPAGYGAPPPQPGFNAPPAASYGAPPPATGYAPAPPAYGGVHTHAAQHFDQPGYSAAPPSYGAPPQQAAPTLAPPSAFAPAAPSYRMAHPDMMMGSAPAQAMHMPHIDASLEASLKESAEYNAPSHFVRGSFGRLPSSAGVASKIRGPMGFTFQPLAPVPSGLPEPPTVNFSTVGSIVRCRRCRTYINPFVVWEAAGRRWTCNLCGFSNETLNTYFGPLDSSGRRADRYEHPELCCGSVDYIAPAEYMVRPPQAPVFVFLIDVTAAAVASGMVDTVTSTIRELITERRLPGGDRCQIGIMTFDSSIHFYSLAARNPQMIVVNDFEDMFVPIAEEVLVPAYENEGSILALLESIPRMFQSNRAAESCLGSAVKAALLGMKHIGGKLLLFASVIPSMRNRAVETVLRGIQGTRNGVDESSNLL
jgi:protein transport protein SEC24